jgi:Histidyl-tRNA synthetase
MNLSLRYDLTVPLARYVNQHYDNIVFPFRRYHIAPVWRGENPDDSHYRQFYQADFDIINNRELNHHHDAEILFMTKKIFDNIDLGDITLRISNRKVLRGLFQYFNCKDNDIHWAIGVVDDMTHMNRTESAHRLCELMDMTEQEAEYILSGLAGANASAQALQFLASLNINNNEFIEGCAELENLLSVLYHLGLTDNDFVIDLTIARSHDYYTGMIFETFLSGKQEWGSVCSGGRYDNLSGSLSKNILPGVGASIGLSRLIIPLINDGLLGTAKLTRGDVFIAFDSEQSVNIQYRVAKNCGIKASIPK